VAATAGYDVVLHDPSREALTRGASGIESSLARMVKKGTLTDSAAGEALSRLSRATELSALSGADLVIEAAPENEALKRSIFTEARPEHATCTPPCARYGPRPAAGARRLGASCRCVIWR
jgi:3-hydroxyacyl-CoA dehydrogenase